MALVHGDCLDVMAAMEPESVDAIVTDPPYGIRFMGKAWDGADIERDAQRDAETRKTLGPDSHGRTRTVSAFGNRAGQAGAYDFTLKGNRAFQAFSQTWAEAAYRVAKPSAYLLAFGGTRTVHRMTVALEDAGWIIRDMLVWGYASGFPKSKASLKPAWEPIVMARKPGPLRMLAIDECRIGWQSDEDKAEATDKNQHSGYANPSSGRDSYSGNMPPRSDYSAPAGRWPANIVLTDPIFDGGIEGVVGGGEATTHPGTMRNDAAGNNWFGPDREAGTLLSSGDSGTYSRFFLIPKADRSDREPVLGGLSGLELGKLDNMGDWPNDAPSKSGGVNRRNLHPTVKPTDLMRHLVRLVTPTGGVVLDPFLGSGTTALAAEMEGFAWIGIEREAEYVAIAEARLNGTQRGLGLETA